MLLSFILIYDRLMDKNEDYNFESLSGAANFDEVIQQPTPDLAV